VRLFGVMWIIGATLYSYRRFDVLTPIFDPSIDFNIAGWPS
jgi:hypothetical protein